MRLFPFVFYTLPYIIRWSERDRKSTRLNSSHTVIYTLSLHDALPISQMMKKSSLRMLSLALYAPFSLCILYATIHNSVERARSEEHTSELQSHSDLHSFPTRRSSDLANDEKIIAAHAFPGTLCAFFPLYSIRYHT